MNTLTEVPQFTETKYLVKVQGVVVSPPCASRQIAESYVLHLTPQQQSLAEIVPITGGGKQVLLG
jgi:hypothetical protein